MSKLHHLISALLSVATLCLSFSSSSQTGTSNFERVVRSSRTGHIVLPDAMFAYVENSDDIASDSSTVADWTYAMRRDLYELWRTPTIDVESEKYVYNSEVIPADIVVTGSEGQPSFILELAVMDGLDTIDTYCAKLQEKLRTFQQPGINQDPLIGAPRHIGFVFGVAEESSLRAEFQFRQGAYCTVSIEESMAMFGNDICQGFQQRLVKNTVSNELFVVSWAVWHPTRPERPVSFISPDINPTTSGSP